MKSCIDVAFATSTDVSIAIYGNVRTVLDSDVITLKCNSLVHKIMFLQKETSLQKELGVESQGPKQYIFVDYIFSNNARKLRFHLFLLFHVRKHMASSFYLKWTEFTRNCEFCSNSGSSGTRTKLEQIYNFL